MRTKRELNSRRILAVSATLALLFSASQAFAATATGNLTVTATVTGSIQLVFNSGSGVSLSSGAGTNAATLAFGSISAYGTPPSGVTIAPTTTLCSGCFAASTPVSVVVNQADVSSANFTLTGYVTTPSGGEKLAVGSSTALSTNSASPTAITASGTYGSGGNNLSVTLAVPTASTGAASYSDIITLTATAN